MRIIIRFEKWILFPIDLSFIVFAILRFINTDWFAGVFSIVISFIIGIIGQSLHKDKTITQLFRGEHLIADATMSNSSITPFESNFLAKAMISSTIVLVIATIVLSAHFTTDNFWIVILKGIAVGIFFPLMSLFFVLMLPKIIEGYRRKL